MSSSPSEPHSRLISQAAKEILTPLGVFRRGRSRTWIDDHDWWLAVVEFQPSSWAKGSYLNVGAMWLWAEQDHLFFDVGHRVKELVRYEIEDQFLPEARRLALLVRERILEIRGEFPSVAAVAQFLVTRAQSSRNSWHLFHAGVAAGYVGRIAEAIACFEKLMENTPEYAWEKALHAKAHQFTDVLRDPPALKMRIEDAVRSTRKILKLPERPITIS